MNENLPGDIISLSGITSVLLRRKWQIVAVFLVVFSAVAAFTFFMPKQYESHMMILVKNERADMIVSAGNGDGSGYRGEVSENAINSEIEILNGFNLLQQVAVQCGLEKLEKTGNRPPAEALPIAIERATVGLQHDLKISSVRKANIIQVDYSDTNPRRAASVLRHLADAYLEAHLKVHGTPGTYQFFSTQADHYQKELKDAEAKQEQFRQDHSIIMLAQQKDAMLQKATESEATLLQANAAIREFTDRIADTRRQLATAPSRIMTQTRVVPNQYSIEHLSSMLAELQNRRTQLLAKFRPEDRLVQEVEKEISDTQVTLEKTAKVTASEQATDINPVHQNLELELAKEQTELAGLEARRQALALQAKSYRSQLMFLGNSTSEYDDLTRTQKKAEENYLLYARKTEEARIAESLDRQKIANVAIAEPPTEPHLPSKPNVRTNLTLGLLLAGFLSLAVAFGAEYVTQTARPAAFDMQPRLDGQSLDTIEHGSELEAFTSLPILATVYVSRQAR
jgi:uncharacterized protein involved in exopolysaccharide biosynthesis